MKWCLCLEWETKALPGMIRGDKIPVCVDIITGQEVCYWCGSDLEDV